MLCVGVRPLSDCSCLTSCLTPRHRFPMQTTPDPSPAAVRGDTPLDPLVEKRSSASPSASSGPVLRKGTTATQRLKQDYLRILKDPVPYVTAHPLPSNILEW